MKFSLLIPRSIRNIIHKRFKRIAFKGDNVYCPCCDSNFITFLPYGIPNRANSMCIGCQSVERHRLIWLYLKKNEKIFLEHVKLLHIAPENIFYKTFSGLNNIDYYPVDLYPENYPSGTQKMDIMNLEFPDNYFDVILCSFVLEYVPNDKKAISELKRVLKPDGWAIIHSFINSDLEKTTDFKLVKENDKDVVGNFNYLRYYGRDYKTRLENSGFKVRTIKNEYSKEELVKYGLLGEDLLICTK